MIEYFILVYIVAPSEQLTADNIDSMAVDRMIVKDDCYCLCGINSWSLLPSSSSIQNILKTLLSMNSRPVYHSAIFSQYFLSSLVHIHEGFRNLSIA